VPLIDTNIRLIQFTHASESIYYERDKQPCHQIQPNSIAQISNPPADRNSQRCLAQPLQDDREAAVLPQARGDECPKKEEQPVNKHEFYLHSDEGQTYDLCQLHELRYKPV
jgi:hypothetical protein